jgi:transcriptional antiterminator RfaH
MLRWFCAWTKHASEFRAERALMAHGFDVCLPLCLEHGRGATNYVLPLFPRYLFVRFDLAADPWKRVYRTQGVDGIIGQRANAPVPVPDGIIEGLISRMSSRRIVDDPHEQTIRAGDQVRVVAGQWNGFEGICKLSRHKRVVLLLSLFQRQTSVELPREHVRPARHAIYQDFSRAASARSE